MAPLQKERIDNGGIFNPSQQCVWRGETEEEEEGWGKAEVSVVHYLLVL